MSKKMSRQASTVSIHAAAASEKRQAEQRLLDATVMECLTRRSLSRSGKTRLPFGITFG